MDDVTVNRSAPVTAEAEIEVAAPIATVWGLITGVDDWPNWNPDVKSASLDGPFAEGSEFRWKAGPGTIRSTVQHVEPPGLMAWTGRTMGVDAVHVHRLTAHDGGTTVRTEESWNGFLPKLMRRTLRRSLERSLDSELDHIKAAAEQRPA
jgi:hypothetical protein